MIEKLYKLEIFVPESHFGLVRKALLSVDSGLIGKYVHCMSWSRVNSSWCPLAGSHPFLGTEGILEEASEIKIEICCKEERLQEIVSIVKAVHPYEEACINIIPMVDSLNL